MEITEDMIRCHKCHDNRWKDLKCMTCGESIELGYIGNRAIYEQLISICEGTEDNA